MPSERGDALTPKEVAIIFGAAKGWTRREIGTDLGISENTVHHYFSSIYRKLDVETVVEMLRAMGFVKLPSEEQMTQMIDVAAIHQRLKKIQEEVDEATEQLDNLP